MSMLAMAHIEFFETFCGCEGFDVDIVGFGLFKVFTAVCLEDFPDVSEEEPIIIFTREETALDKLRANGETKGRHVPPFS